MGFSNLVVRYLNKLESGRQQKKISYVYLSSKRLLPSLGYLDSKLGLGIQRDDKKIELCASGFSICCCFMVLSSFPHRHLNLCLIEVFKLLL